jgi:hypothetical protein
MAILVEGLDGSSDPQVYLGGVQQQGSIQMSDEVIILLKEVSGSSAQIWFAYVRANMNTVQWSPHRDIPYY